MARAHSSHRDYGFGDRPSPPQPPLPIHRAEALWLDPQTDDPDRLMSLIQPYPSEEMEVYPVSTKVNSPRNDSPECLVPVA